MATNVSAYSLSEQAKRINPDGTQATIAEILNREIPMLLDAPWLPSNDIWTNKTVRRASMATGTWRKMNGGVPTSSSAVTEVLDIIGMLEDYSEFDKEYIDNQPDPKQARMDEAQGKIEGLGQTLGSTMLYGNALVDPDKMHGFAPRLGVLDGRFVIGAGGTGSDVTSVYAITWGRTDVHMIYPKNGDATLGVKHRDLGECTITTATTGVASASQFQGYRDHFQVKCGLVVRNPRAIGRVANIETAGTANLFDEDLLIKVLNNMKTNESTRLYVNDTMLSQMQILSKDKANVFFTPGNGNELSGSIPLYFAGVPIRKMAREILLNTETAIT